MKIALAAATLATAALGAPAIAAEAAADPSGVAAAIGAELSHEAEASAARRLLIGKGYDTVSTLDRAPNGHWVGTASKAGKTIFVAVHLPKPVPASN